MTIRGGGHPKQAMVSTPFSRMGPPPRSFAADAHDCIMVRDPRDRPNTRLWRDDPRPMASSPLIVDARLSPSNCARVSGQRSACSGNRDGWSALYRPRFVRHRIACYAARAADESWLWPLAAGGVTPCRLLSQDGLRLAPNTR